MERMRRGNRDDEYVANNLFISTENLPMAETLSVTITQKQNYQFLVDFGEAIPGLLADLPAPLGKGEGPSPEHLMLAAVANCLSASLLFSLQKFKQDVGGITTRATCLV